MINIRTSVFLLLLAAIVLASPVSASLKVSGTVKYMATVAPGVTATFPIVLSIGDADISGDYEISVYGFDNSVDGGYIAIDPALDTGFQSARPYLSVDKKRLHIYSGNPETVTATLAVPATAEGGMYALINVRQVQVTPTGAGAGVSTAINIPVMVTVSGSAITEKGILNKIAIDSSTDPVTITTTFTNIGNHHYYGAKNYIEITNSKDIVIGKFESEPLVTAIVPGGEITFKQTVDIPMEPDTYTVTSFVLKSDETILDNNTNQFTTTVPKVAGVVQVVTPGPEETTQKSPGFAAIISGVAGLIVVVVVRKLRNLNDG